MVMTQNGWSDEPEAEREAGDAWEAGEAERLKQAVPVGSLEDGRRFQHATIEYLRGEVIRVGFGSALVRFDGRKRCHIESKRTGEVVEFDRPRAPETISLATLVIPL